MNDVISALASNAMVVKPLAAVFLLCSLVVIHELGHFLFAKLFGVGVEKFSVGFGPRIVSVQFRGTEYRLSWIPLGGYVRMVGEDPFETPQPEFDESSFLQKAPWKRLLISFGGPLFNLVLPVFLFAGLYLAGAPEPTTWVGMVQDDSPAATAGIQIGDRVVAIGDTPIRYFSELQDALSALALGARTPVTIERSMPDGTSSRQTLDVTLKIHKTYNEWGESIQQNLLGVRPTGARPLLGVVESPLFPAYAAGLQSGDKVLKVNGKAIEWSYQLGQLLADPSLQSLTLEVERDKKPLTVTLTAMQYALPVAQNSEGGEPITMETLRQRHPGAAFGLFPYEIFIKEALPGRPAAKAGLQGGDMLVSVNGKPIVRWLDLKKQIESPVEELKQIQVLRKGELRTIPVQPDVVTRPVAPGETVKEGQIGIRPPEVFQLDEAPLRLGVMEAVVKGVRETMLITEAGLRMLARILTGDIPLSESLGGPISMATIAGESAWISIYQYFRVMALLSMNLGMINLLPIPLLDGGHILFFLLEMLRGRPVSLRLREVAQQLGLLFLLMLMVFALANDVRMNFF